MSGNNFKRFAFYKQKTFYMKKLLFLALIGSLAIPASAQILTGMGTRWSDGFSEWRIFTAEEGEEGTLERIWAMQDDWTEWRYRLGEQAGTIKQKWPNNPHQWEARGEGEIVTARTVYPNDPREWQISDGTHTLRLRLRFANILEEWMLGTDRHGWFEMYTAYEGDPRDWVIVDELQEGLPLTMKMMMSFIVIWNSTPKQ